MSSSKGRSVGQGPCCETLCCPDCKGMKRHSAMSFTKGEGLVMQTHMSIVLCVFMTFEYAFGVLGHLIRMGPEA